MSYPSDKVSNTGNLKNLSDMLIRTRAPMDINMIKDSVPSALIRLLSGNGFSLTETEEVLE